MTNERIDLYHEIGRVLWMIGRLLFLTYKPGAFASSIPVSPLSTLLEDGRSRVRALARHERKHGGPPSPPMCGTLILLDLLSKQGPGLDERCLALSLKCTELAVRWLKRPSLEDSMAVHLLGRGYLLRGGERFSRVADAHFRDVMAGQDARWRRVYGCRYYILAGDRGLHRASLLDDSRRAGNIEKARVCYERALAMHEELRNLHPHDAFEHVLFMLLFKLWVLHVNSQSWDAAKATWNRISTECPDSLEEELPFIRDFPSTASEFVGATQVDSSYVEEVARVLTAAHPLVVRKDHKQAIELAIKCVSVRRSRDSAFLQIPAGMSAP